MWFFTLQIYNDKRRKPCRKKIMCNLKHRITRNNWYNNPIEEDFKWIIFLLITPGEEDLQCGYVNPPLWDGSFDVLVLESMKHCFVVGISRSIHSILSLRLSVWLDSIFCLLNSITVEHIVWYCIETNSRRWWRNCKLAHDIYVLWHRNGYYIIYKLTTSSSVWRQAHRSYFCEVQVAKVKGTTDVIFLFHPCTVEKREAYIDPHDQVAIQTSKNKGDVKHTWRISGCLHQSLLHCGSESHSLK